MNDTLVGILRGIAPALATVVAGPLGGAAVTAIAQKFGVQDTVEAVTKAIQTDSEAAAKLAEIDLKQFEIEQTNITARHQADMSSDSKLAKNIRPLTLIFLLAAYFIFAMMSAFGYETRGAYVELLGQWGMLIMSFYFGGRTLEKIVDLWNKK